MYCEVGIAKLSPAQISRLRNGHKTRIKMGDCHKVHLSQEQLKKLNSAHKKGKAYTVLFDPYQVEKHCCGTLPLPLSFHPPGILLCQAACGSRTHPPLNHRGGPSEGRGRDLMGHPSGGWPSPLDPAPVLHRETQKLLVSR